MRERTAREHLSDARRQPGEPGRAVGIGIGIELRFGLAGSGSARVSARAVSRCRADDDEVPAVTGSGSSVEDALVALAGVVDRRAPAFLAWGARDVTLSRVEVAGLAPPALAGLLGRLAAEGVAAVSFDAHAAAGRCATAVRWDQAGVDDAVATATRAGFRIVGVAPSALLLSRTGGSDAARAAAHVAAGLVTIGPLRPLAAALRPPAAPRPWVVERLPDPGPTRPPPRPTRRRWPPHRR